MSKELDEEQMVNYAIQLLKKGKVLPVDLEGALIRGGFDVAYMKEIYSA